MNDRVVEIAGFLAAHGWGTAQSVAVAADLSPRRYARLTKDSGESAILMDADKDQKTPQFFAIAKVLRACGICAPTIFAADLRRDLLLMDDFGDQNFGKLLDAGGDASTLFKRAVDVLIELHDHFEPSLLEDVQLPRFDNLLFIEQAGLFLDCYFPFVKNRPASDAEREAFDAAWNLVLQRLLDVPHSLMLRDYMPDNLMALPEPAVDLMATDRMATDLTANDPKAAETGNDNRGTISSLTTVSLTGVLDFQDAGLGPIAYDLASLFEVVRRDGASAFRDEMIRYYHSEAKPGLSLASLRDAVDILSAQRHCRILGILLRWTQTTGRPDKLPWIQRTEIHFKELLALEALQPLRRWATDLKLFT